VKGGGFYVHRRKRRVSNTDDIIFGDWKRPGGQKNEHISTGTIPTKYINLTGAEEVNPWRAQSS